MKMTFQRKGPGLVPADRAAEAFCARTSQMTCVMVEARKPRNLKHHRLLFAMLQKVADNLDGVTADQLLAVIKLRTGHADVVRTRKGEVWIPKSIAFESMDQLAFNEFYDRALQFIITDVLPGVDKAELEAEVLEMVA